MLIDFTTAKGTVSVKTRSMIKAQTIAMLKTRIGLEVIDSPKGLAICVGTDRGTGADIWAVIDPTITMTLEVKEKVSKAKAEATEVLPNIFG